MDRQTKQWIADRVIWIIASALAVLITVPAMAGEQDRLTVAADRATAQCGRPDRGDMDIEV